MKKSFFKDYYRYRLRELRGFFIASCILSFLSGPLLFTGFIIVQRAENVDYTGGYGLLSVMMVELYILVITVPALILLGMIMPIASRRHLNRKAYVDTMGTLPITYKQRYWGDLLAELTVYAAPVVVCGLFMLTEVFIYANSGKEDIVFGDMKQTIPFLFSATLTLIFSCIGGLALSDLVTQCSGKVGSGILSSVLAAFLLPTIVLSLGTIGGKYALGVDETHAATDACLAIPPIGWLIKLTFYPDFDNFLEMRFAVKSPILFIALLAMIAAFIVGGYFIGKKRKPELVGENLVFETASCVISIGIAAAVMSVFMINLKNEPKASDFIIMLAATFVIFMAFEVLNRRKKIRILRSFIRYACVCAAGLGFFALMRATNGLGAEDYLPKPGSVSEVSISSGSRWGSPDKYTFSDKSAVKGVIDQHKEILRSKDILSTGDDLVISYKLKNGLEIIREYYVNSETAITSFTKPLLNLPQEGNNPLKLLKDESIELSARISKNIPAETSADPDFIPGSYISSYIVKPEKMSELRKLLISDIENNFSKFLIHNDDLEKSKYGSLQIFYYENGELQYEFYEIDKAYAQTVAFFEDPDNLTIALEASYDPENTYIVCYNFDGGSFNARFSRSRNNPLPPELAALFTSKKTGEEYSERFEIKCYEDLGSEFFIRKADEKRAAELFLNAMKNFKFDDDAYFYGNDNTED